MQIDFYAPHLKIGSALRKKVEESLQRITEKDPFLLKWEKQGLVRAKVIIKKPRIFHYVKADLLHSSQSKGKKNFKLSLLLFFNGQKITATDYGDDLYLLIGLVQKKLEGELRRQRKKWLKRKEKEAQLIKKIHFWSKD